jgi:hypothetical protein
MLEGVTNMYSQKKLSFIRGADRVTQGSQDSQSMEETTEAEMVTKRIEKKMSCKSAVHLFNEYQNIAA